MAVCDSIASPTYLYKVISLARSTTFQTSIIFLQTHKIFTDNMPSAQFFIPNKSVGDKLNSEDFRIRGYNPLTSPELLQHTIPQTEKSKETVLAGTRDYHHFPKRV